MILKYIMDTNKTEKNEPDSTPPQSRCNVTLLIWIILGVVSSVTLQNYTSRQIDKSWNCSADLQIDHIALPAFAIYGKGKSDYHLRHVFDILNKLGYTKTTLESDWDLLWAHDYPFRVFSHEMKNIKDYQIVNHFPGCGYITNKVDLVTSDLPYIPRAFRLPADKHIFLKYATKNTDKLFVEKHNEHRNIYIKAANEINLESNSTFIQEFVANPYLVDGYKFDIGVYVIITSINPLRVYMYKGDVLFRFCSTKYYPFEVENLDKYVVGDNYLPIWELPSLSHYYNVLKFSMKDSFDAHVRKNQQDPEMFWEQVEDIIRSVILTKEPKIIDVLKAYKHRHNFFELMRFDFILDDNLKVHLMEANMSPNLSSAHFKQNALLYEQVLYSLFNLVGIGTSLKQTSPRGRLKALETMISSDKNIVVNAEICSNASCSNSCSGNECQVCKQCLGDEYSRILHSTFREHIQRTDTRRIFPKPIKNLQEYKLEEEVKLLSSKNEFITRWFHGKCKLDPTWCF